MSSEIEVSKDSIWMKMSNDNFTTHNCISEPTAAFTKMMEL